MTTYYFIRHAEKERNGQQDPHLTPKGKQRAKKWSRVLDNKGIDLIFCTTLQRTKETAGPLAEKLGLSIRSYPANDLYNLKFQQETQGKTVLVVGHQDTTPAFVNRILGKQKYHYISAENNGNLYRVTIDDQQRIIAELTHIAL